MLREIKAKIAKAVVYLGDPPPVVRKYISKLLRLATALLATNVRSFE